MKSNIIYISLQQNQNQMHNGCYDFRSDHLKAREGMLFPKMLTFFLYFLCPILLQLA